MNAVPEFDPIPYLYVLVIIVAVLCLIVWLVEVVIQPLVERRVRKWLGEGGQ